MKGSGEQPTLQSVAYGLRGIQTVHLFSAWPILLMSAVPGAFNPEPFQGSTSQMSLELASPIAGLHFFSDLHYHL